MTPQRADTGPARTTHGDSGKRLQDIALLRLRSMAVRRLRWVRLAEPAHSGLAADV